MKKILFLCFLSVSVMASFDSIPVSEDYIQMVQEKVHMEGLPVKCVVRANVTDSNGRTCKDTFGVMAIAVGPEGLDQEYVSACYEYKFEAEDDMKFLQNQGVCKR